MPYLIDSDIVIDHLANVPDITHLLETLATQGIAISIITYMETYQGVLRSPQREIADTKFQAFLETVWSEPILPDTEGSQLRGNGVQVASNSAGGK